MRKSKGNLTRFLKKLTFEKWKIRVEKLGHYCTFEHEFFLSDKDYHPPLEQQHPISMKGIPFRHVQEKGPGDTNPYHHTKGYRRLSPKRLALNNNLK